MFVKQSVRWQLKNLSKHYSTEERVLEELLKQSGWKYGEVKGQKPILTDEDIFPLIRMFTMARKATLPLLVLGRSPDVWYPTLVQNFGPLGMDVMLAGMDNKKWANLDWKKDPRELQARWELEEMARNDPLFGGNGSVIMEKKWSLAMNDAVIIGAACGGKELHIAGGLQVPVFDLRDSELWNPVYKSPSILGRELVLAGLMKYKQFQHPYDQLGIVLHKQRQDEKLDLEELFETLEGLQSGEDLRRIYKKLY